MLCFAGYPQLSLVYAQSTAQQMFDSEYLHYELCYSTAKLDTQFRCT